MRITQENFSVRKRVSSHVVSSSPVRPSSVSSSFFGEKKRRSKDHSTLITLTACVVFFVAVFLVFSDRANTKTNKLRTSSELTFSGREQKTCALTISATNNFGFVINLHDSVMTNSPSIDCFVWFMGDDPEPKDPDGKKGMAEIKEKISHLKNFKMVTLQDMQESLDGFFPLHLTFKFTLQELQTTIKPFAFQYIFQELKPDSAIYLDNDIWVTGSFEELQDDLAKYSAIVTPHITSPGPKDQLFLENRQFLQAGIYNFGFVAFSNTESTNKFLNFWGSHLIDFGFIDASNGMFFDQIWGDYIPSFFGRDDHLVLRDHRYNIAYWNLHERGAGLHMKDGLPHIENPLTKEVEKAIFVHFSSMSSLEDYDINGISRYQTRYTVQDFPRIRDVILAFLDRLRRYDTMHYRYIPYGFKKFSNGIEITEDLRKIFAGISYETPFFTDNISNDPYDAKYTFSPFVRLWFRQHVDWTNPFCASKQCLTDPAKQTFLHWSVSSNPHFPIDFTGKAFFTDIERTIWESRSDLRAAFPDPTGGNHAEFKSWFEASVLREGLVEKRIFEIWSDSWKHHKHYHFNFHKLVETSDDIGVNIFGWHCGVFGIGVASTKLYHSAKRVGLAANAVEPHNIHGPQYVSPTAVGIEMTRSLSEAVTIVAMNAPETTVYYRSQVSEAIHSKKYNIGYWNWELDVFPADWMTFLDNFDEVWVPSTFNKMAMEATPDYDGTIVKVLPIPQDTQHDNIPKGNDENKLNSIIGNSIKKTISKLPLELKNKIQDVTSKPFVFLVVFDFNSYTERKNPTASIRAFVDAFPLSEDQDGTKYQLIVKTHTGDGNQMNELLEIAKHDPRVIFINSVISDEENKALHEYQDCYISLHRSEGYGMNILESMASGVPVIATDYSGNAMFFEDMPNLKDKCTFPVSYKLVQIQKTSGPYTKENHWAEPDHNSAVQAMREASKNECRKSGLGRDMIKQVHDLYGFEAIGEKMETFLIEALPRIKEKNNLWAH